MNLFLKPIPAPARRRARAPGGRRRLRARVGSKGHGIMAAQAQEKTCAERIGLDRALERAGFPAKQSDKMCYYQEPSGSVR
eukprot:COSAG02_NODE_1681_length_11351_cov_20.077320_12_plen_81_part_00